MQKPPLNAFSLSHLLHLHRRRVDERQLERHHRYEEVPVHRLVGPVRHREVEVVVGGRGGAVVEVQEAGGVHVRLGFERKKMNGRAIINKRI